MFHRAVFSIFLLLLFASLACVAPSRLFAPPVPATPPGSGAMMAETPLAEAPDPTRTPAVVEKTIAPELTTLSLFCPYSPVTAALLQETSPEQWVGWIEKLSGAEPVMIGGEETRITTRFSPAMFSANPAARAFDYVLETVRGWYPQEQIAVQEYQVEDKQGNAHTWKNLVLTLPGAERADETVILSAHLDSISSEDPEHVAPGAEDNGSGSAALLEAARILRSHTFARTIQIAWFTGEEEGLLGSHAFVKDLAAPEKVVGVVNLDMFGYDSDSDRCFELHVGSLPQSGQVGQCFIDSIGAYGLDLPRYDYLTEEATGGSDHGQFWDAGIGAIEVLEDMIAQEMPNGCPASDPNPGYHSAEDTVEKINPHSGIELVRAALATISALAGPME